MHRFSKELEQDVPVLKEMVRQQGEKLTDQKFSLAENWSEEKRKVILEEISAGGQKIQTQAYKDFL